MVQPIGAVLESLSVQSRGTHPGGSSTLVHIVQIPLLILIDTVQYLGPLSPGSADPGQTGGTVVDIESIAISLIPHLLLHYADAGLISHCVGGLGRCLQYLMSHGMHQGVEWSSVYRLNEVLTLVLAVLGIDLGNHDSNSNGSSNGSDGDGDSNNTTSTILQGLTQVEMDDEEEAILKDVALSTLVVICVYGCEHVSTGSSVPTITLSL